MSKAATTDVGCYVESWWGRYAGAHMIARASEFGYSDGRALDLANRHLASMSPNGAASLTDDELDELADSVDGAEQWLNDNATPAGCSFGWQDGEFFLSADDDDDDL